MSDKPNPGSEEAIAKGCTCPVLDNCHGRGAYGNADRYGFWYDAGCPLHDLDADIQDSWNRGRATLTSNTSTESGDE